MVERIAKFHDSHGAAFRPRAPYARLPSKRAAAGLRMRVIALPGAGTFHLYIREHLDEEIQKDQGSA